MIDSQKHIDFDITKPLVTVIVLCYRNLDCILPNLHSIEQQDYPRIELILADDGSEDFSGDRVFEALANINRFEKVQIFSNPHNLGTVANYNNAIKKSSGSIIVPLSADDSFYDNHVVSRIVKEFEQKDVYVCIAKRIGQISNEIYPSERDIDIILKNQNVIDRMCYTGLFSGSTLYFLKDFWASIGGFDERYRLLEDYPFCLKIYEKHFKIHFVDIVSIVYGEKGITSNAKSISPVLRKDFNVLYSYLIDLTKNKRCRAFVEYTKFKNTHRSSLLTILFCAFFHPVLLLKMFSFNLRKKKNEYDFYDYYLKERQK